MRGDFLSIIMVFLFSLNSYGLTFDTNLNSELKDQMVQDLEFMSHLEGENPTALHRKIYGEIDGPSYKEFFNSRISSVGISDCGSPIAVACVYMFRPHKMWITNNFIKFSHPQIARLMIVYHEARHSEVKNGNWGHAVCPTPFQDEFGNEIKSIWTGSSLAGEDACDSTPLGSYGSTTILLHNISTSCTNCTDKVKMDARIYSDDQLNRMIDGAREEILNDFASN